MMQKKVLEFIRENGLFHENEHVIAAVSGGADSVCLLLLLKELKGELGIGLSAVHVHHGIRGESADRDEEYVRELCKQLEVPVISRHVDVPAFAAEHRLSEEEAARELRYRVFCEVLAETGADKIAIAHHLDDQAETILFRMMRGSGLRGLAGMQPVRDRFVRPLLTVTRGEITAYLREKGVIWREDETNAEDHASRNRIRHNVLPAMQGVRADAAEKIAETGAYLGEIDDFMRGEAERFIAAHVKCMAGENAEIQALQLPEAPYRTLHPALKLYVIRLLLEKIGCRMKDKGREHLLQADALMDRRVGRCVQLPGDGYIVRGYEGITVYRTKENAEKRGAAETSPENGGICAKTRIFTNENGLIYPENQYTKWFDYDKIKEPVIIRHRQTGDLFSTLPGTKKKLKDHLIDEKIPREERDALYLAASGQDVLWVIGYRMSEAYKVTEQTKTIIEIAILIGGEENER